MNGPILLLSMVGITVALMVLFAIQIPKGMKVGEKIRARQKADALAREQANREQAAAAEPTGLKRPAP